MKEHEGCIFITISDKCEIGSFNYLIFFLEMNSIQMTLMCIIIYVSTYTYICRCIVIYASLCLNIRDIQKSQWGEKVMYLISYLIPRVCEGEPTVAGLGKEEGSSRRNCLRDHKYFYTWERRE